MTGVDIAGRGSHEVEYGVYGRAVAFRLPRARTWAASYLSTGRVCRLRGPTKTDVTYVFDDNVHLTGELRAGRHTRTRTLDSRGDVVAEISGGRKSTYLRAPDGSLKVTTRTFGPAACECASACTVEPEQPWDVLRSSR